MALVLVAAVAFVGVMASSGAAAPGPPAVVEVSPPYPAWRASPYSDVTAVFSEEMRRVSINSNTFRLVQVGTETPVVGSVSYNTAARKATLNPDSTLTPGVYRATITQGAKDLEGVPLDQDPASEQVGPKVWTFRISAEQADPTPLTVTGWTPPSEARPRATTTNVTATFSEKVKPESVSSNTFKLVKSDADGTTTPIETAATYDVATKTATLDPTADLEPGRYKATVTPGVRDLANHQFDQKAWPGDQHHEWWFKVTDAPIPNDTKPPTLIAVHPRGEYATKNVPGNYTMTGLFSEEMDPASINSTTVTLTKDSVESIPIKVTYDVVYRHLFIDPVADMEPGEYTARVTRFVKDLAGNQFDQDPTLPGNQSKGWKFTVVESTP